MKRFTSSHPTHLTMPSLPQWIAQRNVEVDVPVDNASANFASSLLLSGSGEWFYSTPQYSHQVFHDAAACKSGQPPFSVDDSDRTLLAQRQIGGIKSMWNELPKASQDAILTAMAVTECERTYGTQNSRCSHLTSSLGMYLGKSES